MLTMKSNTAGVVKVHIEGDLGYADLYTADTVCVFLSESDVINISPIVSVCVSHAQVSKETY